ncbi:hypothetical protein K440DRAFT_664086 [Wilcoxina mikolae CBS 423.85]|nr:hypothetical protein K440DRAFT_664086 [Wilcoxina mikolae CBS 423.85]
MEGITVGEPPKAPMPPMTEVHIYRDGDMILEVTDGVEQRRFTVVSHILCIASPVFRAMLGRHSSFRERREFEMQDESFLFVLELPEEESVEAMEIMLNAIHLQNDKVPTIISFNKLVQIAVICDKYDMSKAVHPQVSFWMQQNERLALLDNYEDWLFISWVFRRSKTFESLSRKMILHIRGDDSGTWKLATPTRNIQGHIPDSVAGWSPS